MKLTASSCVLALWLVVAPSAAAWPGRPPNPPAVQGTTGPPPAWLETPTRSLWLAFSSFCWNTVCADYMPPQSRTDLPLLSLRRGANVRLHLAFKPTEVHATTFVGSRFTHTKLRPAKIVLWRPIRSGIVSFDVRAPQGSAAYLVRLRLN